MSRLIDADKLEPDTEWNDYDDGFMSYSQSQIRNAEEIKAVSIDNVKQARERIENINPVYSTGDDRTHVLKNCDDIKTEVLSILDKMLESEE